METPVFLSVLAAVVLVVLYQIRRELRKGAEPKREVAAPRIVEVPAIPQPVEQMVVAPTPPPPAQPSAVLQPPAVEVAEPPKPKPAKRPKPIVATAPVKASTVATVLGMLKQRDSLAAAFLLREIFDRPVSRRRRHR